MESLAELQLEAIMQHLSQCPKELSPNKDYMLGLAEGIRIAYATPNPSMEDEFNSQVADLMMAPYEPDDTLEDEDFVRTTS